MKLSREKIQRMIDGRGNSGGTGGGGGEGAGGASQAWVESNFVSIAYFTRLIKAYGPGATASDPDVEVVPNDVDSTITSIKAMFGLWTEQFISALGQGTGGSGSATSLADLVDVQINTSTLAQGQALLYDGNGHWYNGTVQGGSISMTDVWTALAANTNEQINASHLQGLFTDLSNTNNNQISMTIGDTTRTLTVGYASAANIANHVYCTTHIGSWQLSIDYDEISHFWLTGKYNDYALPCAVDYATSAGSAGSAGYVEGTNAAASPDGALLRSGANRSDDSPSGDTWIFYDTLGGPSSYWGIRHSQGPNRIDFCGHGALTSYIDLNTGGIVCNGLTSNYDIAAGNNITAGGNLTVTGTGTFGNVLSNGYVTALSDVRLKRVLGHVELTAEKIAKASAIRFAWKDGHDKREHVGGIAQEWQELLPQAVVDVDGRLSMDYSAIAYVSVVSLANKVVAQQREIDSLKAENAKLEKRLERLEKMFAITGDEEE
ncbi:MAG: tail fiber domain-containing protein [Mogibacterium sp.]|nr:tail fiber domain-containing protein [Mogibacterium sp.]